MFSKFKNGIRLAMLIFSIISALLAFTFGYGVLYNKISTIEKTMSNDIPHIQKDIYELKTDMQNLKKQINFVIEYYLEKGMGR